MCSFSQRTPADDLILTADRDLINLLGVAHHERSKLLEDFSSNWLGVRV
jgi:hypothetical protein